MGALFNLDNPVWRFIGKLADVFVLHLVCLICCIPIVTIGPAITALYYVMIKEVRDEESHIIRMYFKSFKLNFKQGIIIWLIMLVLGIFFAVDIWYYKQIMEGTVSKVLLIVFLALLIVYVFVLTYVFPVLSRFDNTVKKTLIYAFMLSVRHLPWTLLILVIEVGLFILGIYVVPVYPVIGIGLTAFLTAYIFNHLFDKYIPEEEHDDHFGELGDELEPEHVVLSADDMGAAPVRITMEDMEKKKKQEVELGVMEPVRPAKSEMNAEATDSTGITENEESVDSAE